jgi:hypothetical protein
LAIFSNWANFIHWASFETSVIFLKRRISPMVVRFWATFYKNNFLTFLTK